MVSRALLEDKKYPKLLKKIGKDAPKQLYYKGVWDKEIFKNCLAVVGSRHITTYGKQVVERIVGELAAVGVTIVSGFMYGVDAAAHKAALRVGGRTIAVMPCGIDLIHPEYQQDLYMEILNNKGLVISEYEGSFFPTLWTYPRRNRIVAGISQAALIIEAGEKSGSLITANFAKKFKRKVFVVPGPITSENSKGINQLLKEGAAVATSAKDILDYYVGVDVGRLQLDQLDKICRRPTSTTKREGSHLEQQIFSHLQREPVGVDELVRVLGKRASDLGVILSTMELKGIIKQEGNRYYAN